MPLVFIPSRGLGLGPGSGSGSVALWQDLCQHAQFLHIYALLIVCLFARICVLIIVS